MAKIGLQASTVAKRRTEGAHRVMHSEGEAAIRLLNERGYPSARRSNGQSEHRCPFHEEPGALKGAPATKFYVDSTTSKFYCHSAACGAKGNLVTLERQFGVDVSFADPRFMSRSKQLETWQKHLEADPALKQVFYDHGLDDATISRFRYGYDPEKKRYVIPYLDGKTPVALRYYQPNPSEYTDESGKRKMGLKYYWETGDSATLYNYNDACGDDRGRVFVCEGELKAAALVQMGYNAVATPGAGMFKDEWHKHFSDARHIYVLFDNDNPRHEKNKRQIEKCAPCRSRNLSECAGHNPGQEAAAKVTVLLGHRANNILLPLPDDTTRKTDINEFFVRDGNTASDFAQLALGEKSEPFKVLTLAEIMQDPPLQAAMLVEQGILPSQGRLLIAGKPKVGKSIFAENLVLSIAAGIPFLGQFQVDHPARVLLLDRELSKSSLYERMKQLIKYRPGYTPAAVNLCIDHDHLIKIDREGAYETLERLVTYNGAEVVVFDTAYKFFSKSMDNATSMTAAFEVLDKLIHETGVSVILTHHNKKTQKNKSGPAQDIADPDDVAGSFLWTGWPNSTISLNYMGNSVENPFNAVCTFTAFRDAPPPEPLGLYRSRDSLGYSAVRPHFHEETGESHSYTAPRKPTTELIVAWLLANAPLPEQEAMESLCRDFGVSDTVVRPYFLDAMQSGYFRKRGRPTIIEYFDDKEGQSWEEDRQLHLVPGHGEEFVNKSLL
jgi:hypothetical protein